MSIGRRKLPHDPPLGIPADEALFFITICSKNRRAHELLENSRPGILLDAVRTRHETGIWFAHLFLVMPDHVHAIIHFCHPSHPMRKAILDFKRWTARTGAFHWQTDFFDHRLRHDESAGEKADYILMNPVRARLVDAPEKWPHRFIAREALG